LNYSGENLKDFYNKEYFDNYYGNIRNYDWYRKILSIIVKNGIPGISLELGCGLGFLGEIGKNWGMNFINIDISSAAIERNPDFDLTIADITKKIPVLDGSVHNVIMNQIFEHIDSNLVDYVLSEIKRVLVPGGKLFIFAPSKYNKKESSKPDHINLISQSKLEKIVNNSGFEDILPIEFGANNIFTNSRLEQRLVSIFYHNIFKFDQLNRSASCIATNPNNS
jgi:SAM-dependent methyltransferase